MKVAFVTPQQEKDGISLYAKDLIGSLRKEIDLSIFGMVRGEEKDWGSWAEKINKADLMHLQHEYSWWGSYTNPWRNKFSAFMSRIKIPKVVTYHSVDLLGLKKPSWVWWGRRQHLKVFDVADKVIVHAQALKEGLVKYGIREDKIHVIPIGVPAKREIRKTGVLEKYGLVGKKFIAIFGYINPDKGYEATLSAIKKLPNLYLVIAGDTQDETNREYKENLVRTISSNPNLKNRVVITGYLPEEESFELMQESQAILLPRTHVNASLELSNTVSLGKAIIASDLPYFLEVNQRYNCLAICKKGSTDSLEEVLKKVVENASFRQELESETKEYAKRYSWDFVGGETVKVYQDLLKAPNLKWGFI